MESGSGVAGLASSTEDPRSMPRRLFSWLRRRRESENPDERLVAMVILMVMEILAIAPYRSRGAVPHSAVTDHGSKQALYFLLFGLLYGWTILFLLGQIPQQAGRRRDQLIYKAAIKAFGGCKRLLVSLSHLPAVAAAVFAAAIAPAQPQLSTAQQGLRSQQSTVEEELQPDQSTVKEELQPNQSTAGEELQPDQSTVEEELQPDQSTFEEGQFQHSTTEEGFILVNIWNIESLKQCLRNLIASFMEINHPIQIAAAHSANGSSCSSPMHFHYTYRGALVNENNKDQCHQFKSLSLLDHGDIYLINDSSLLQLEERNNVFQDNSYVVDGFLCDVFKLVDLSIDALTHMVDYESAKRCVLNFKVMAQLLCLMKSVLDKVECISFDQNLKDCYFTLCARGSIQKLIDAADSVSMLVWSASDIYQMLVLYEAIADVHGAFSLFQQMQVYIEERFDIIFQQMQKNFEGIFHADLNSCEITHGRHPMTIFLIQSMKLFENHKSIVQRVCTGDATSSGNLLFEVIRYWANKLMTDSDSYTEGRKQIFLLNNMAFVTWEIKKPLQTLVPNLRAEIIEFLESLTNKYSIEYRSECWGPVRSYLELSSGRRPRLSSLKKFRSEFEAILDCQGTWELETPVKRVLREDIKNYMIPCYYAFLQELRKKPDLRLKLIFCKYITPEELKKASGQFV